MKLIYLIFSSVILLVVIFLFLKRRRRRKKFFQDMNYSEEGKNIAMSITNCKKLHRELAKTIHPDKLSDDKREQADKLMQEINSAKYDYNKLIKLKLEVEQFLNSNVQ